MPEWILKLARRIMALRPGRYAIILTVCDMHDWTVVELGKVEFSQSDVSHKHKLLDGGGHNHGLKDLTHNHDGQ